MTRKLGRKIGHRKSLLRNLAASLVLYEKIDTTRAKAKEVRSEVERLIALGKKQNLSSYRKLIGYFYDKNAAKKVFRELSSRYGKRQSGFVRVYQLGSRLGDNSQIVRLELVDRKVFIDPNKKAEDKTKEKSPEKKTDKKALRAEKKLEKLTKTKEQAGVVTQVRTKAARKTGV